MSNSNAVKVLVAEDHSGQRLVLSESLRMFSNDTFEVLTVDNGQDAVTQVVNGNYDIVLMDLRMPVMDGHRAIQMIRECSDVPIIVLSAWDTKKDRRLAKASGADKFLKKPVNYQELVLKIRQMVKDVSETD